MSNLLVKPMARALIALATVTAMGCAFGATSSPSSAAFGAKTPVSGPMKATPPDGNTYNGQFFRITETTTIESVAPLWSAWNSAWSGRSGWAYWNATPSSDFIRNYAGQFVAVLGAADGERMRCRFRLVHPEDGMAGGGAGQCQTSDGKTVDALFH
jgi:hypothetical protein